VFWSKIWFFLVAVAAVLGLGVALTMPRPAERKALDAEDVRLAQAIESVRLVMVQDARKRADIALLYARHEIYKELKKIKEDAESAEAIGQQLHDSAKSTLDAMLASTAGAKPQLLIALDAWGRVVARTGGDAASDKEWGDDLSGFFLVRDALRGYIRDDLWLMGGKLYRVAAAPVIARPEAGVESYVGVLVVGYEVDEALARGLEPTASSRPCGEKAEGGGGSAEPCDTHIAFFARGETVANSGPNTLATDIKNELMRRAGEITNDHDMWFVVEGEATTYRVVARRLPGEVGAQDGFYVAYAERPHGVGFAGLLKSVTKDDLGFGNFPWLALGGGFAAALIIGLALMWLESDRPLKRLVKDALAVGKGDRRAFSEDLHRGKHGSIARSVNLAIDKLSREKPGRRDLGALYVSDDSGSAEAVRALPSPGPMGPPPSSFAPPPPSDFALDAHGQPAGQFEYVAPPPPPPLPLPLPPNATPAPPPRAIPRQSASIGLGELPMAMPPPVSVRPTPAPPPLTPARVARTSGPAAIPPMPAPPPPAPLPPPPPPGTGLSALDDDILGHHDPEDAQLVTPPPPTMPDIRAGASSSALSVTTLPEQLADTSGLVRGQSTSEGESAYFRQVYEDFIELKRKCGENTDSLTFDKFLIKLTQNRDQLIAKYACKAVKFQVYVKDGKAALKATPVK
jgi:hypothetical protein